MRKTVLLVFLLLCSLSLLAEVSVTNVTVKPRWPWNGLVDVTYTVEGEPGQHCSVTFSGRDLVRDQDIEMKSMSGTGARFLVSPGTHTATWDAAKDLPEEYHTPSFVVNVEATPAEPRYLVVDLSEGPNANRYPVGYATTPPDIKKDDACRTTELWLRRIPAGTFWMGSPKSETGRWNVETRHQVTLTQDYYIGVFECTQRQWELVMGSRPSYFKNDGDYATRPVEQVSYDDVRGTVWPSSGHIVDATSFMGRLQAKTGLTFDLPTEAQWEYACRAGTTTALNSGKDLSSDKQDDNVAEVARYWWNGGGVDDGKEGKLPEADCDTSHGTAKVGSYLPNAWGLYDCHGNVCEWCLDWCTGDLGTSAATDPVGPKSGTTRVDKGGTWYRSANTCRSAYRQEHAPDDVESWIGFRVAYIPVEKAYLVIDLSAGADAERYPYCYSEVGPDLSNDACRTTELWLRRIPAGSFMMGSPEDEKGRRKDYETQHKVTLTKDYYIGVFECTQRQWELVMGSNPSEYKGDTRPVDRVSYDDVRGADWPSSGHTVGEGTFMGRLQARTGLVFDLPTEAQWEYACRAGTTTALNSGKDASDENMKEVGRYSGNCGNDHHAKVGCYLPNTWGLYDMHGNVFEWCLDWWGDYPTNAVTDPQGPSSGVNRMIRGGEWCSYVLCRSAYRFFNAPSSCLDGFRVACALPVNTYLVIDISNGVDATHYPHRFTELPPDLSDDACRTTELWLRRIPKGTFWMGSPESETGRWNVETQHKVTLTQDYYIGVFECTQRQWELVMGSRPSYFYNDYATRPVEQVSYDDVRGTSWPFSGHIVDAASFMGRLQAKTSLPFDLPTEAEWEYACRAGTTTALNSGKNLASDKQDDNVAEVARYWWNGGGVDDGKDGKIPEADCDTSHGTAKVGSYLPNAWGLYDCHGNVCEWCLDWCTGDLGTSATTDPVGPKSGTNRVDKGGTWYRSANTCRSAYRQEHAPGGSESWIGFRVAYMPAEKAYLVIDLSEGADAERYPYRYSEVAPDLSNDACRTTELWLRYIPAGTFWMGSPDSETGRYHDETRHKVTLTRDYYIGVFECTQRQWELVMGNRPSAFSNPDYYSTRPVEQVSYDDVRGAGWPSSGHTAGEGTFMGRLQKRTGLTFDLPTEAQWEYACRAGTTTALNSGKNLSDTKKDDNVAEVGRYVYNSRSTSLDFLNLSYYTTDYGTAKVGSYLPNAWGLYDMHGNVLEWCLDWYGDYPTSAVTDPQGASSGSFRVSRGGSWYFIAQGCRSAFRNFRTPSYRYYYFGFRVAFCP
ncbi:MAG: formylglycine-generating enzyme family protein [Victivallales bacterium]|nr:formylglycine-generating enzyme family protein [Victivallales bacterium]